MNKYNIFLKSGHKIEINYQEEGNKNLIGLWVWASRQKDIKILTLVDGLTGTQHAINSEEIATITQSDYTPHMEVMGAHSAKGKSLIIEREEQRKREQEAYKNKMEEDFENLVQATVEEQEVNENRDIRKGYGRNGNAPRNWRLF